MKILTIVGARGAGKSTALLAMMADRKKAAKQRCELLTVAKGKVNAAKAATKAWLDQGNQTDQVYVDFEGRPTPAFMQWLKLQCEIAGVKFLVIAHGE
jgi:ABC-type cobalamin transport system ATPase subunit